MVLDNHGNPVKRSIGFASSVVRESMDQREPQVSLIGFQIRAEGIDSDEVDEGAE